MESVTDDMQQLVDERFWVGEEAGHQEGKPMTNTIVKTQATEAEPLTLEIDRTCACCWKFRLRDATGAIVWSNRVYPHVQGEAGARSRMTAWVEQYGYRIVEGRQRKRA